MVLKRKRPSISPRRWGGLAMILGGVLFVAFGVIFFVFTHGSTSVDHNGTLFGLGGTAYCRMEVAWPALLLAGLLALRPAYSARPGWLGRSGLVVAVLSLGLQIMSVVMQCWLKDPHVAADFESVTLTLGFYLGALSYLLLAAGMVAFGITTIRAGASGWGRFLPLTIGVLVMPTVLFSMSGISGGGPGWDLIYASSRLPLGLGWVSLGLALASNGVESSSRPETTR